MDGKRIDPVRDLVRKTFRDFGAEESDLEGMSDTILIREGRYYGRTFRTDKLMAMWMGGLVQFYDADGEMLKTVLIGRQPESLARAA